MRGPRQGRTMAGLLAATLALTLTVVATPPAAAQVASPLREPTRFTNPNGVTIADKQAPAGWLGLAPDGATQKGFFVGQSNRSVAIDAYGYAAGRKPSTITTGDMVTLGEYGDLSVDGDVVDVAVGTLATGSDDLYVAVLHNVAGVAKLTFRGPLSAGMPPIDSREVVSDADDAVGVILLDNHIVVALRDEIRFYRPTTPGLPENVEYRRRVASDSVLGIARDEGTSANAPRTYAILRADLSQRCVSVIELFSEPARLAGAVPNGHQLGCTDQPSETFRRGDLTYVGYDDPLGGGPVFGPPGAPRDAAFAAEMIVGSIFPTTPDTSVMFTDSTAALASSLPWPTCENHAAAGAAVIEVRDLNTRTTRALLRAACLGIPDAAGNATLTMYFPGHGSGTRNDFTSVSVSTRLDAGVAAAPRDLVIGFPCNEVDRRTTSSDCAAFPTAVSAIVVADQSTESTLISHTFRRSPISTRFDADPNLWGAEVPLGLQLTPVDLDELKLVVELDSQFSGCVVGTNGPCNPSIRESRPIPIALLAAPPTLAGANQGGYAPVFAQSTTAGTSATTTESSSFAFSVDAAPSLADVFEFGAEATISTQIDSSSTTSLTTTSANGYGGSMDHDVVVYRTTENQVYTGTVIESSTGVELNRSTEILIPAGQVTTTGSWTALQQQFPEEFSPNRPDNRGPGEMYASIAAAFSNSVGAPATYLTTPAGSSPDDAVNSYCIGDLSGTSPLKPGAVSVELNPFYGEDAELFPPNQKAILTSGWHVVGAGSNAVETASFDIQAGSEYSYMQSRSLDINIVAKFFGAGNEYRGGHTWGTGQSTSLSTGTQFIGGVGQFPHSSLADETYFWRMVLCKRNVTDAGPVWVLTYQVRGYTGDGVEPLNPPDAVGPVDSAFTSFNPVLEFAGSEIQADYTVEVDAVSAPDARRFTVSPTPAAPGTNHTVRVGGRQLLPGELYRWQVTATDVVGRTSIGSTGFFRTRGTPNPIALLDGSNQSQVLDVGETVTLSDGGDDGGEPITSRSFLVNGSTVGTGATVDWSPPAAGVYLVEVRSTNAYGTSSAESTVFAAPVGRLDRYQLDEDGEIVVDAANGVMANDTGGTSAVLGMTSGNGTLTFEQDGSFSYMPATNQCGDYGFDYMLIDVVSSVDPTPVQLDITCENDPPTAIASTYTGTEDAPITASSPGVLAGATDPDTVANGAPTDDTLTAMLVSQPLQGTVTLDADGAFTYLGGTDFCGTDTFDFAAEDSSGARSSTETVTITVLCVNDAPTAVDDVYAAVAGDPLVVGAATGLLINDTDSDGDTLTVATKSEPKSGALTLEPDGSFVFESDDIGSVTFDYVVTDGLDKATGSVTIDVQPPVTFPDPPPVVPDVVADPGAGGAVVTYPTPVVPGATVVCTPPSGSIFPIGVTEVTCTASVGERPAAAFSAAALVAPQDTDIVFTVTVIDTEPPRFDSAPTDIVIDDGTGPTVVDFLLPTATDNDPRPMTIGCDPTPGSTFPVGSTLVRCAATDASGLMAETSFTVSVVAMPDLNGQLPATGSSTGRLVTFATVFVGLGLALTLLTQRRRRVRPA